MQQVLLTLILKEKGRANGIKRSVFKLAYNPADPVL